MKYEDCFGKKQGIYLLDANVFICAQHSDPRAIFCQQVLLEGNVATTDLVISELDEMRPEVKVYKVKKMTDEILQLKANTEKKASLQDLSLIQVAIDNPEIVGILTYDLDFKRVASAGIVQSKSNYRDKFFVGTPEEYLKKVKKR
jgi:hypothetical protein